MTLGFDTLIVTGKTSRKGMQYCLKSYTQLGGFSFIKSSCGIQL